MVSLWTKLDRTGHWLQTVSTHTHTLSTQTPLCLNNLATVSDKSAKFLGVHITDNLTWTLNTTRITKKNPSRIYVLYEEAEESPSPNLYPDNILQRGQLRASSAAPSQHKRACRELWGGQKIKIPGASLPSLTDLFNSRCLYKAMSRIRDTTHPFHALFSLLPSGRRFRSITAHTFRMGRSFFTQEIRLLHNP